MSEGSAIFCIVECFALVMALKFVWWKPLISLINRRKWRNDPNAPAIQLVIELLDEQGWNETSYLLNHVSGVSIWTANNDYGLSINLNGEARPCSEGSDITLNPYWRSQLWSRVKQFKMESKIAALERKKLKFAENVVQFTKRQA